MFDIRSQINALRSWFARWCQRRLDFGRISLATTRPTTGITPQGTNDESVAAKGLATGESLKLSRVCSECQESCV